MTDSEKVFSLFEGCGLVWLLYRDLGKLSPPALTTL